jgi:hypothetical protein
MFHAIFEVILESEDGSVAKLQFIDLAGEEPFFE